MGFMHEDFELSPEARRVRRIGGSEVLNSYDTASAIFAGQAATNGLILALENRVGQLPQVSAHTHVLVVDDGRQDGIAKAVQLGMSRSGIVQGLGDLPSPFGDEPDIRVLDDPKVRAEALRRLGPNVRRALSFAAYLYELPFDNRQQFGMPLSFVTKDNREMGLAPSKQVMTHPLATLDYVSNGLPDFRTRHEPKVERPHMRLRNQQMARIVEGLQWAIARGASERVTAQSDSDRSLVG